jgi:hypothetical protein
VIRSPSAAPPLACEFESQRPLCARHQGQGKASSAAQQGSARQAGRRGLLEGGLAIAASEAGSSRAARAAACQAAILAMAAACCDSSDAATADDR